MTQYNCDWSDSVTSSTSLGRSSLYSRSYSDVVTVSDVEVRYVDRMLGLSDTVTITDHDINPALKFPRDKITVIDTFKPDQAIRSRSDSVDGVDVYITGIKNLQLIEIVTVVDTFKGPYILTLHDSIITTDAERSNVELLGIPDAIHAVDVYVRHGTLPITITETLSIQDAYTLGKSVQLTTTDHIYASDAFRRPKYLDFTDTVTATDAGTKNPWGIAYEHLTSDDMYQAINTTPFKDGIISIDTYKVSKIVSLGLFDTVVSLDYRLQLIVNHLTENG